MTKRDIIALIVILSGAVIVGVGAARAGDLPDPRLTPGANDPDVVRPGITAADICPVAHTPMYRNVSQKLKMEIYREYGVKPHQGYCSGPEGCEIDHLCSLELSCTNSPKNLWVEPYGGTPWNAHVKDHLENRLHAMVCAGKISLSDAQSEISSDWIAAYKKYIGPDPH